jgi:hypothetical protein
MLAEQVHFPRPSDGKKLVSFEWAPIRYRNVISVLKNPFYAGAYAYGKGEKRTEIVDGRARKSYGHRRPLEEWEVLLKDRHDGYIDWAEFERNQKQLAINAYGKAGGAKSGRGGRALLAGLIFCGRCGRHLMVTYSGLRRDSPSIGVSVRTRCWGCPGASPSAACGSMPRLPESFSAPWSRWRSRRLWRPSGGTWKLDVKNNASWSSSCSRLAMKLRSRNGDTLPAIPTIA